MHSLFLLTDVLVSIGASIILIQLSYRKLPKQRAIWALLALAYVVFDPIYNIFLTPCNLWHAVAGLSLVLPSYVLCLRYAFGPLAAKRVPPPVLDERLAERLALQIEQEEDARWAEIEQRWLEAKATEDSGETIKIPKNQHA